MRTIACAGLFLLSTLALGADYTGRFEGEQLTVTVRAAQGRYAGLIEAEGKKFLLTGMEAGGRLVGTFESEGNRFEFTAALEGDSLTLTTGDTSYTLKRHAEATNPLAKRGRPSAEGRGLRPKEAAAGAHNVLRFRKVSVPDQPDMIGGEGFTFLAPPDWEVDGGIVWRAHPTMPASVDMRVRNPKGLEQMEVFPTVAFSWGGYLGPARCSRPARTTWATRCSRRCRTRSPT